MSVIRTKALILRHSTDREHDRMIVVLTPKHGQMRIRARGTKKSTSKLGGSLEPLMEVDLNIADGRTTGLVTGSVVLDRFESLRRDAISLTMAQWLLELVEAVTKPEQAAEALYRLTKEALLTMGDEVEWPVGRRWLALCRRGFDVMRHEGFAPPLDTCGVCHRTLAADAAAYHPRQGFTHRSEAYPDALTLSAATVEYLRHGRQPEADRAVFRQARPLVELLVHHTLDRPLKSERVLRSVVRLEQLPNSRIAR
ncbi:MAG: DNA repair protein RecO [Patescibacteria group bacterium]